MWLVAGHAVDLGVNFRDIGRIGHIGDRMAFDRMAASELQGQHHHFILCEIVVGQFHAAVEIWLSTCSASRFLGCRIRAVTLEAKAIRILRTQQMIVRPAVWLVAGSASLLKGWLM